MPGDWIICYFIDRDLQPICSLVHCQMHVWWKIFINLIYLANTVHTNILIYLRNYTYILNVYWFFLYMLYLLQDVAVQGSRQRSFSCSVIYFLRHTKSLLLFHFKLPTYLVSIICGVPNWRRDDATIQMFTGHTRIHTLLWICIIIWCPHRKTGMFIHLHNI